MRYTHSGFLQVLTIDMPPASLLRVGRCARAIAVLIVAAIVQPAFTCAQTLNVLFAFPYNANTTSNYPDGANPYAEMIEGADGNYYTTTIAGGAGTCPGLSQVIPGCGAIVKITPSGQLSVVYSFPYDSSSQTAPEGLNPQAGLVQGPDGNFYGAATYGGSLGAAGPCITPSRIGGGCGTIFKITPAGKATVLHTFCGGNGCGSLATDGYLPAGRLIFGTDGNLYGTTQFGGVFQGVFNSGTIFRISRSGTYKILHVFSGNSNTGDGANPAAGLIQASDGNFYGTTMSGGTSGIYGTVFKMTHSGAVTVLHSFMSVNDLNGAQPEGALVEASDGNLYGTAASGGANGRGTVFRVSKSGVFKKTYDFTQAAGNVGFLPKAGLIQASDGNLYGTAWEGGGPTQVGSIYQLTLPGIATLEAGFDGQNTGSAPVDALLQGSDGKLYVTSQNGGGPNGSGVQGTLAVLSASLPPPKPSISGFRPAKAKVGQKVMVSGTSFVGTTAVTFHGTSSSFVVNASGFVTATVPAGATSGRISVTTAGGIATSKNDFTVLP
jgi:uncharacterized repeat protein (TIGR03803 family)